MRFLKNKIAQAKAFRTLHAKKEIKKQESIKLKEEVPIEKPLRMPKKGSTREDYRATKNIAQNYGRAICNFALSDIAESYIRPILEEFEITSKQFRDYMRKTKAFVDGLHHFRQALLVNQADSPLTRALKQAFRLIGEIFVKYFSVNWIFSGRMEYKKAYLKYRFKILRRIQNPELFTYIK